MTDDGATYASIADARAEYARTSSRLLRMADAHNRYPRQFSPLARCPGCAVLAQDVDAASVALDMATAWTFAGRHPRGQARREVPA